MNVHLQEQKLLFIKHVIKSEVHLWTYSLQQISLHIWSNESVEPPYKNKNCYSVQNMKLQEHMFHPLIFLGYWSIGSRDTLKTFTNCSALNCSLFWPGPTISIKCSDSVCITQLNNLGSQNVVKSNPLNNEVKNPPNYHNK